MDESPHTSLVATRKMWLDFCKKCKFPVPEANPVMIVYLLDQVSVYQASLANPTPSDALENTSLFDGDDVYYHFGGATICAMLKRRYNELKNCLRTDRNALSIQVCMLQAVNCKDKFSIPDYLRYRDQGFMYFPHHTLIPFLCDLDAVVKKAVNEDAFCKHGDDVIKVCL